MEKIKVEIWSDIRCPFCYLGKKRFEGALAQFPQKEMVEVEWHSFQLDPYVVTQPGKSVYDHLAEVKGISREQSVQAHQQIVLQGNQLGLMYNFGKAVVANSFHAHRLAHMAKTYHRENEMEELLFRAYFTEGKNIADIDTLILLGKEAGLPPEILESVMYGEEYSDNVLMDQSYAKELGINAVPFFLFNEKLSVRGAQPLEVFLSALIKSLEAVPEDRGKSYFFRKF